MHMIFRTMLHLAMARLRPRLGYDEVARSNFITLPTDLDVLNHMNNGVYFSIADVARFEMLSRTGTLQSLKRLGWYPVVASETISFRKSLNPWQRFTIESRIAGHDAKAVYLEHRFVRPDTEGRPEIYAQAFVKARFLRKTGGTVPVPELLEGLGVDSESGVPEWVERWGADVALPPTRAAAPSNWA